MKGTLDLKQFAPHFLSSGKQNNNLVNVISDLYQNQIQEPSNVHNYYMFKNDQEFQRPEGEPQSIKRMLINKNQKVSEQPKLQSHMSAQTPESNLIKPAPLKYLTPQYVQEEENDEQPILQGSQSAKEPQNLNKKFQRKNSFGSETSSFSKPQKGQYFNNTIIQKNYINIQANELQINILPHQTKKK